MIIEPARETEVVAETDLLAVVPAGIAAATAAARTGARTIMLEKYGFLGGMGTAAMVTNFCGLHASINGSVQQVVRCRRRYLGTLDLLMGSASRIP